MSITFSPGCGNDTWVHYPAPIAGSDSCYFNFVITEGPCIMTYNNLYEPCKCDTSGTCKSETACDSSTTYCVNSVLCNGQPITFPPTGTPELSVSGSCTYTKAASIAATTSTTVSITTSASGGITLTKSSMLIAASLVLFGFIGTFN